MRLFARLLPLLLTASPAMAGVSLGVDFRDAVGGLVGLGAVLFFMILCFRGDKNPLRPVLSPISAWSASCAATAAAAALSSKRNRS